MTDYAAKVAALEEAAGSGELTVKTDGREVTYRSMADLMRALSYFRSQMAASGATTGPESYGSTLATWGTD